MGIFPRTESIPELPVMAEVRAGLALGASWEAEAGVVRLRANGSAVVVLLNWGVRLLP